jgi:hypothetical protein
MPTASSYRNGNEQASLSASDIDADWADDDRLHGHLQVANRAFELYHTAINNINQVPDRSQRSRMQAKLSEAAASGWGRGVSDLNEAFEHLATNNGKWRDNNVKSYFGGPNKCIDAMVIKGPSAAANFLNAADNGAEILVRETEAFRNQKARAESARNRDDWGTIGEAIARIKTGAETVTPWLWTAPAYQRVGTRTASFADVFGKIHVGATAYADMRGKAGWSQEESAVYAGLVVAVDFLPILGAFYGEALKMLPGMIANWQVFIDDYHRNKLRPERHLTF